jgi:activator of 2-hydroxyglutaryl-CoA dehydratase
MVVGVGTLLLVMLGGVVTVELIRTLLPNAVRHVVVEGGSEVFPTLGASLLASERREVGCMLGREKVLDSRRI